MVLLLGVIVERSMDRAFKHLVVKTELLAQISQLEEEIGYCEKHEKRHSILDSLCVDCQEEWNVEVGKRAYGVPVPTRTIEDIRPVPKGEKR